VIFTAGTDPPVASFVVEESQSGGSILSLVAGLATSSASELFGRAKSFLPVSSINATTAGAGGDGKRAGTPTGGIGGLSGGSTSGEGKSINSHSLTPLSTTTDTTNLKKREKLPGITINQENAVWDDPKRKVTQMALSPCYRWAACCDSLGRVLLIDVASCIVLKMLKGYREAQAAWIIPSSSSPSLESTNLIKTENSQNSPAAAAAAALLVVYAPRRGVVELWKPHSGVRVGSISTSVPQKGVLLEQPAVPQSLVGIKMSSPLSSSGSSYQSWRSFHSNSCWMMDLESLDLVNLTDKLNQLILNSS
jgi:hypothetical protein